MSNTFLLMKLVLFFCFLFGGNAAKTLRQYASCLKTFSVLESEFLGRINNESETFCTILHRNCELETWSLNHLEPMDYELRRKCMRVCVSLRVCVSFLCKIVVCVCVCLSFNIHLVRFVQLDFLFEQKPHTCFKYHFSQQEPRLIQ